MKEEEEAQEKEERPKVKRYVEEESEKRMRIEQVESRKNKNI